MTDRSVGLVFAFLNSACSQFWILAKRIPNPSNPRSYDNERLVGIRPTVIYSFIHYIPRSVVRSPNMAPIGCRES